MMNQIIALIFYAYVSNKEMFGRGDRGEQPVSNGHGGGRHVAEGKLEEHITKAINQQ